MTAATDRLEQQLARDLERLGERLADDRLCSDLYAAIAGHALHPHGGEGRLAPSWGRAEALVNAARAAHGRPALTGLAQSGREGELSDRARDALAELGWDLRPRTTGAPDPGHTSRSSEPHAEPPPPPGGADASPDWERRAHEEADAERHRRRPA